MIARSLRPAQTDHESQEVRRSGGIFLMVVGRVFRPGATAGLKGPPYKIEMPPVLPISCKPSGAASMYSGASSFRE